MDPDPDPGCPKIYTDPDSDPQHCVGDFNLPDIQGCSSKEVQSKSTVLIAKRQLVPEKFCKIKK